MTQMQLPESFRVPHYLQEGSLPSAMLPEAMRAHVTCHFTAAAARGVLHTDLCSSFTVSSHSMRIAPVPRRCNQTQISVV